MVASHIINTYTGSHIYFVNCAKVIAQFAAVDPHKLTNAVPAKLHLLASWSRILSIHVRMMHESDHIFGLQITALFPEGFGANMTPFETREPGSFDAPVEFVEEDGKIVGVEIFGGNGDMKREREDSVRGRARPWFDKV